MKQILIGLVILAISFAGGYYLGTKTQPESITTPIIVFDTIQVDNPDTVFITQTAEIETLDTLIIDTSRTDTIYAPILYHIAKTDIEVGNWKIHIEYNTQIQEFKIDYSEFQEVVPRILYAEKKAISLGVQSIGYFGEESKLSLSFMIGFPRILDNLYITLGAISDEAIGIGITYIF